MDIVNPEVRWSEGHGPRPKIQTARGLDRALAALGHANPVRVQAAACTIFNAPHQFVPSCSELNNSIHVSPIESVCHGSS